MQWKVALFKANAMLTILINISCLWLKQYHSLQYYFKRERQRELYAQICMIETKQHRLSKDSVFTKIHFEKENTKIVSAEIALRSKCSY